MKLQAIYVISFTRLFVFSLFFASVLPPSVFAYEGLIHTDLAMMSRILLIEKEYPDAEILNYADYLAFGTWYEDEVDIVYGIGNNPGLPPYSPTVTHFWDADSGPLDQVTLGAYGPYPNAFVKSCALWDMAVSVYPTNKAYAYQLLGHITHLLGDMSVNAHAHEDMHPSGDYYEDYVFAQWHWLMNEIDQTKINEGLINFIPPVTDLVKSQVLPRFHQLYYLMYTTNQRGDFFGSDDYAGDSSDFSFWSSGNENGWMGDYNYELIANGWTYYQQADSLDALHCRVIAQYYVLPYVIRVTATLFKLFGIAVGDPAFVCHGNFNKNGGSDVDIDGKDLLIFAEHFVRNDCAVASECQGDFDKDNDIDESDLEIFVNNFGKNNCTLQ